MLKYFVLKILGTFDFYHQFKIFRFLKKNNLKNFNIFFDIGAHKGESINLFLKNLNIKRIYSFESSPLNYLELKKNLPKLQRKFKKTIININNLTLGSVTSQGTIKQIDESSSSTLNNININSKYFKRKKALVYNKNKKDFYKEITINISTLSNYLEVNNIDQVDFVKIDTEGYEYKILKGLNKNFTKIKIIMFEHHYHDMIEKGYTFTDIHGLLSRNNFIQL